MGLYRYVDSKEQLLTLVPDHLLVGVVGRVRETVSGIAALRAVADGLVDVLREHPNAAPLLARPQSGPGMVAAAKHVVDLLAADGASPADAFEMLRAVVAQVVGEHVTSHGGPGTLGLELLLDGVVRHMAGRRSPPPG